MIEVAGLYIAELLESPAPALQFEAARALLRLSSLAKRVANSGAAASLQFTTPLCPIKTALLLVGSVGMIVPQSAAAWH